MAFWKNKSSGFCFSEASSQENDPRSRIGRGQSPRRGCRFAATRDEKDMAFEIQAGLSASLHLRSQSFKMTRLIWISG